MKLSITQQTLLNSIIEHESLKDVLVRLHDQSYDIVDCSLISMGDKNNNGYNILISSQLSSSQYTIDDIESFKLVEQINFE